MRAESARSEARSENKVINIDSNLGQHFLAFHRMEENEKDRELVANGKQIFEITCKQREELNIAIFSRLKLCKIYCLEREFPQST